MSSSKRVDKTAIRDVFVEEQPLFMISTHGSIHRSTSVFRTLVVAILVRSFTSGVQHTSFISGVQHTSFISVNDIGIYQYLYETLPATQHVHTVVCTH